MYLIYETIIKTTKINIGQRIKSGLGFGYDGPREYNSSIKLCGMDEPVEVKRELQCSIVVKCEVTKNVEHYMQVRTIGFSEIGSIHVNELITQYSADNRPSIGSVLEGKVLMKDNIKEEAAEETALARSSDIAE